MSESPAPEIEEVTGAPPLAPTPNPLEVVWGNETDELCKQAGAIVLNAIMQIEQLVEAAKKVTWGKEIAKKFPT